MMHEATPPICTDKSYATVTIQPPDVTTNSADSAGGEPMTYRLIKQNVQLRAERNFYRDLLRQIRERN